MVSRLRKIEQTDKPLYYFEWLDVKYMRAEFAADENKMKRIEKVAQKCLDFLETRQIGEDEKKKLPKIGEVQIGKTQPMLEEI